MPKVNEDDYDFTPGFTPPPTEQGRSQGENRFLELLPACFHLDVCFHMLKLESNPATYFSFYGKNRTC
jgi:hypothetical protein